jgi:hypothetical protein
MDGPNFKPNSEPIAPGFSPFEPALAGLRRLQAVRRIAGLQPDAFRERITMNSTNNDQNQKQLDHEMIEAVITASLPHLRKRLAEFKRLAAESPDFTDEQRAQILRLEKTLDELSTDPEPIENQPKNAAENPFAFFNQPFTPGFTPGQEADKGRTDAGQTPDTDRTSSGQTADKLDELTSLEKEIVEDLNQASQSPLDKLPAEKQAQLYDLVAHQPISAVLNALSIPAPQGWGLRTSRQSLYRFRDRYREIKRREHRRQMKTAAQAVLEDLEGADEQFANASERLLKLRLLETANDPASKTRDLRDLFTTLIRIRAVSKPGIAAEKQG